MYTYNTNQEPLKLKEYGRNVQRLITQLQKIEDKTLRKQHAEAILKIMGILHSGNGKTTTEYLQKRWDDLFVIADYQLDVNSPYAVPSKELSIKEPERLNYSQQPVKYRHCGRHIELLVKRAVEVTDPIKQTQMIMGIAKLIKNFSAVWNKDNLDMHAVMNIIQDLAGGKLIIDLEKLKAENSLPASSNYTPKENPKANPKEANYKEANPKEANYKATATAKKERNKATRKKKKASFVA